MVAHPVFVLSGNQDLIINLIEDKACLDEEQTDFQ